MKQATGSQASALRTKHIMRLGVGALGLVLIAAGRALAGDCLDEHRTIAGAPQSSTERFTFTIQEGSPYPKYDVTISMTRGRADLRIVDPAGRILTEFGAQKCTANAPIQGATRPGAYTVQVTTIAAIGEWHVRIYAGPALVAQLGPALASAISIILAALTCMWLGRTRFKGPLAEIRERRKAYVVLNVAFYGLVAAAMVAVAFKPAAQHFLQRVMQQSFSIGSLSYVGAAYKGHHVLLAISLTFLINLVFGALAAITLPSLLIPFVGLLTGLLRATAWGLALSPTSAKLGMAMIPHSLTLVLEGQAYILAMFAAYIQGCAFLRPQSVGAPTHLKGYAAGLKRAARIYPLIVALLAISAIYESLEVIYIVAALK